MKAILQKILSILSVEKLAGKRTFTLAFIAGVVTTANYLGFVSNELAIEIYKWLGIGTVVTLRLAVPPKQ